MDLGVLRTVVSSLAEAGDHEALYARLAATLRRCGFTHFSHFIVRHADPARPHSFVSDYPSDWIAHYRASRYRLVDPVIGRANGSLLPFAWDAEDWHAGAVDRAQRRMLGEAVDAGVGHGVTVPIYGPGMGFATLSALSDRRGRALAAQHAEVGPLVHLAAIYLHATVAETEVEQPPTAVRLSPRERECLTWTARGKTAWEISEILCISEATVVFHLKNAMQRLSVYSKHHAVVTALMRGLISP